MYWNEHPHFHSASYSSFISEPTATGQIQYEVYINTNTAKCK